MQGTYNKSSFFNVLTTLTTHFTSNNTSIFKFRQHGSSTLLISKTNTTNKRKLKSIFTVLEAVEGSYVLSRSILHHARDISSLSVSREKRSRVFSRLEKQTLNRMGKRLRREQVRLATPWRPRSGSLSDTSATAGAAVWMRRRQRARLSGCDGGAASMAAAIRRR